MLRPLRMVGLLTLFLVVLSACDWPQVNFDAQQTSVNPYEPALTASSVQRLTQAWSAPAGDVLVAAGVAYTESHAPDVTGPDTARAFNLSTGALLWTASLAHQSFIQAVGNGLVYYSPGPVALDAKTGTLRWVENAGTPAVLDGTRVFALRQTGGASDDATVITAIDQGTMIWSVTAGGAPVGAVVQGGNLIVLTFIFLNNQPQGILLVRTYDKTNGALVRIESAPAKDAQGNVDFPVQHLSAGPRFIYFNTVALRGNSTDLFAVDPATGAVAWHAATSEQVDALALTQNAVIVTDHSSGATPVTHMTAYNATTGGPLWDTTVCTGFPIVVAGNLAFGGHCVHDLTTGAFITDLHNETLVAAQGHVFLHDRGSGQIRAMVPSP